MPAPYDRVEMCDIPAGERDQQARRCRLARPAGCRRWAWFALVHCALLVPSTTEGQDGAPKTPNLEIAIEAGVVAITGVTPGAHVAVLGVNRSHNGIMPVFRRESDVLMDDDRDGVVTWEVRGTPLRAVWVAVDLVTGAFAVSTPSADGVKEVALPVDAVRRGPSGKLDQVLHRGFHAEVFLARAAEGGGRSWLLSANDGGEDDRDGVQDGRVEVSLPSFEGVGPEAEPPPKELGPGDVLLVVDRHTLQFSIVRFTA